LKRCGRYPPPQTSTSGHRRHFSEGGQAVLPVEQLRVVEDIVEGVVLDVEAEP
jgi:hypothetical protein